MAFKFYWGAIAAIVVLVSSLIIPGVIAYPDYFIARGDAVWVGEMHPEGTCWYFPTAGTGTLYDLPSVYMDNQTFCRLDTGQTWNMSPRDYTLIYEEPTPANGKYFKDVSWINGSLVSTFSAVHSIDESAQDAPAVMRDLTKIIVHNGFNNFSESQITIQEPDLKITSIDQTGKNNYTISGTSNYADGTPITIKIDEERYFAEHDDSFTYQTQVVRPAFDRSGTWRKTMPMLIQEMPPGWHNVTIYAGDLVTTSRFKIDQHAWSPAPTPTGYVNYLSNGDIAPVTVVVTIVQTPEIIYQDRWYTATPTPDITDALGGTVGYPYSTGDIIPPWVGIIGLIVIIGIVMVRDWKRK